MPDTFLGIGTKEYGRRDVEPDGSYVTTKFFVIFYLPVWPLETRRVRYKIDKYVNRIDIRRYKLKRLPLCWPQVLGVMATGFAVLIGALIGAVIFLRLVFAVLE